MLRRAVQGAKTPVPGYQECQGDHSQALSFGHDNFSITLLGGHMIRVAKIAKLPLPADPSGLHEWQACKSCHSSTDDIDKCQQGKPWS